MMDFQSRNVMIIPQLCDNFIITINPMVSFVFFRKIEKKKRKKRDWIKKERRNEALLDSKIMSSIVRFISLYTQA